MNIVIILPDLGGGGAERLHINLAKYWSYLGHNIDFLLMRRTGSLLNEVPKEINVIDLGAARIRQAIIPIARNIINIKPDIILSAMWPLTSVTVIAWILSGKKNKLFLSDHVILSLDSVNNLNVPLLLLKTLIIGTYYFSSGIIAVSNGVKKDLCSLGRLPYKKVRVIYNPVAINVPENNIKLSCELWGAGHEKRILSVGSLKHEKDYKTLINAIALIRGSVNIKLIILGEGPLRRELEQLIVSFELEGIVTLPGFYIDPYPWYLSADLFVLSSKWEGFGNVIVEALGSGLPVVSTDCPGGPGEILDNGRYGDLVKVGDVVALTHAIKKNLNTKHDATLLIDRAKNFSVQEISEQYLNFFASKPK